MIYLTGDMHGDDSRLYDSQWRKLKAGDVLIVCGDFGFVWDDSPQEKSVLKYLGSRKFTVCFLDGPHENFDLLERYRQTVWKGGKVHRISGNLFHLMRGEIFEIEGHRLFVCGGGESPDKDIRTEQGRWWKNELPTPAELAHCVENLDEIGGSVDYILTHEPPALVKSAMLLRNGQPDHVDKLNGFFGEIESYCNFRHWYFGSMHEDRTVTPKHTCVFNRLLPLGEDFSKSKKRRIPELFQKPKRAETAEPEPDFLIANPFQKEK